MCTKNLDAHACHEVCWDSVYSGGTDIASDIKFMWSDRTNASDSL